MVEGCGAVDALVRVDADPRGEPAADAGTSSQLTSPREATVKAATDLYGAGSAAVTSVNEAWNAVGVPLPILHQARYKPAEAVTAPTLILKHRDPSLSVPLAPATDDVESEWQIWSETFALPRLKAATRLRPSRAAPCPSL